MQLLQDSGAFVTDALCKHFVGESQLVVWMTSQIKTHHKTLAINHRLNNKGKRVLQGEGLRQLTCCKLNAHRNRSFCFPVHTQNVLGHPKTERLSNGHISKDSVLSGRKPLVSLLVCFKSFLEGFSKETFLQNKLC